MDDFYDIGQANADLDIDTIADLDLYSGVDIRTVEGFEYPAMLITGVKFKDSLRVLQSVRKESYRLLDVWIDLEDGSEPVKQGSLPADIHTFLAMRYLGLMVTLYLGENDIMALNLRDPKVLEQFI